jgi:DNA polymerase-3 subunit delta
MLLLLYGAETYLARIRIQELKEKAIAQGQFVREIDCRETDLKDVFLELNSPSLFDFKKLFIFHSPFSSKELSEKRALDILLKANLHTLVFVDSEVKKTDSLFKLLLKHGKSEEFLKLKGNQLKNWIEREITKYGASFEFGAIDLLLFSCEDDLERLSREIAKLVAFKRFSSTKTVTKEDVTSLVKMHSEPKIFSTIDAISEKDKKSATNLLARHLYKGESPFSLLSMFAWQFRILLSIKDMEERGVLRQEIAAKLKLKSFVAQKSFAATQRFSFEELKELYRKIFSLDLAFKTGKGNPDQLLYLFVAMACGKEKQRF